ncbi:MarR family transcriptional regulator [Pontibacillus yanchengensis]|uniref:MarR family transcriptional regulator n=2 Tax=Pontibacillus yanchengensis TaxID=462910 RepID=A0A6I4ZX61_9BACI|nr:MarR family transcriptional regulator [Pontibacillus yanchengensis]MYL32540.1 MarR family transcriptional regulator [Pontibacillus yanchengensis]MYL53121.1 MarR family transcriptional regulator [Pontibacillus yanchengensis]
MTSNDKVVTLYNRFERLWMNLAEEEDRFKEYGISSTLEALLTTIIRIKHPTTTQLSEEMNISKSAVSQMVTKLEDGDFVKKAVDPDDKRVQHLELGPKGKDYAKDLKRYETHVYNLFAESLNEEEVEQVSQSFEKILQVLKKKN